MTELIRVGFNARLLRAADLRGWNRYTINLLAELPARGVELLLYTDQPIHNDHLQRLPNGSYTVRLGAVRPYAAWEQIWLPRACRTDRVDLLHAPANFGLPAISPCPTILTLHDAIANVYRDPHRPPRESWSPSSVRSKLAHWVSRSRADRVITVSEHARGDLVNRLGLPASKVRVTPEAADPSFLRPVSEAQRLRVKARHGLQKPYVFYVGGWEGRKNLPFLVRAFAQANLQHVDLVLAGGRDHLRARLVQEAETLGIGDHLKLLGWVDDSDLPGLYSGALCLAYPSEYEGFGLQVCEALAVGCPVLAARATSLPEVVGDGGETFSLASTDELTRLLKRVAADPQYRDDLCRRARVRSKAFSWRRTAEATAAVYRELLPEPRRGHACASADRS